ncbi:uncharacterized protein LOC121413077 [Lytechinus variegatus]|uniref:uncharacterized protein LOC121413077 n=1 Tax=Lytechinus variegatus TaxID=7654 RepID=UPI001BB268EC|nr:uncharacterized protein LOC121413077 [Lytechinus variegatus]
MSDSENELEDEYFGEPFSTPPELSSTPEWEYVDQRISKRFGVREMALGKLPKTFGLKELKKGYFPHFFNKRDNANYIGPLPDKMYYGFDSMMKRDQEVFSAWYRELNEEGYVFDMKKELREYCISDVQILHQSCKVFRGHFKALTTTPTNPKGIDPFLKSLTLPSACNLLYRTNYLQPGKIGLIPQDGYTSAKKQSISAGEWLHHETITKGIDIQHAFNGGERMVHGRYVDGYCEMGEKNTCGNF